MKREHIEWSRQHFELLKIGGIWGVPRSGLMFMRTGENELTLTGRMPYDKAMPITKDQLKEQQQNDYEGIYAHFTAAGITVKNNTNKETTNATED